MDRASIADQAEGTDPEEAGAVESPPRVRFRDASRLHPSGAGRFEAEIDPEWTIAGKPNGGYLLATMGRAALALSSHRHVICASAQYLRSPEPGSATIETEVLRAGRSASQLRARLLQGGEPCIESLLTTADMNARGQPYWTDGLPEGKAGVAGHAGYDECVRLTPQTPDGRRVAILDQVEVRLDQGSRGFAEGRPSGRGELRGWLTLPEDEPFDTTSLLFAVDSFPPATFDIEFAGWVPTLELTVYVRALPAPGPVRILQRAQLIDAQRVDELCYVWDVTGRLVAQGSQLAAIRLG